MTNASIMVLILLVVTASASIDVFPSEVDNYAPLNHHSFIDQIAKSPMLRILLND